MKRLVPLLAALLAVGALGALPAAAASSATATWRGVVVAKDRQHRAFVTAFKSGDVRLLPAGRAFSRTPVGARLVARVRVTPTGALSVLSLRRVGAAKAALVRGTVIRLLPRRAIVGAGGAVLSVRLQRTRSSARTVASSSSPPRAGDAVQLDVRIGQSGSLAATGMTVLSAATPAATEGKLEVRGTLTSLDPPSVTTGTGVVVSCLVGPLGLPAGVSPGQVVEMSCDLLNGQWQLRRLQSESAVGAPSGGDQAQAGDDDDDDDDDEHADHQKGDHSSSHRDDEHDEDDD